jgi:hypothetical protein
MVSAAMRSIPSSSSGTSIRKAAAAVDMAQPQRYRAPRRDAMIYRTLFVAAALVLASAVPARADIVAATGTASLVSADAALLAKIGFIPDPNGSFEFSYSYDSTSASGPGTFKLVSKSATGAVLDTVDLNPTTVFVSEIGNGPGHPLDEYLAGALTARDGTRFEILVDLADRTGWCFRPSPATPAITSII